MTEPRNDTEHAVLKLNAGTLVVTRAHGRLYGQWRAAGSRYASTTPIALADGSKFFGSGCALVENEKRDERVRQQRRGA